MKRICLVLTCLFLAVGCKNSSVESEPKLSENKLGVVYTKANSPLPSNHIFSAEVDKAGKLWLGMQDNIATFDGEKWTVKGFPAGVSSFDFDMENKAWIVSFNGNLYNFDGQNINKYTHKNAPSNVTCLAINQSGDIAAGTTEGLYYYKPEKDTWRDYNEVNSNISRSSIYDVAFDNSGKLWLTTGAGSISTFDGQDFSFYNFLDYGYQNHGSRDLIIDANNKKWMNPSYIGIARFNISGMVIFDKDNFELSGSYIETIALDKNNDIWAAYPGIITNDHQDAALIHMVDANNFAFYTMQNSDLPHHTIFDIATDTSENIWAATDNGLFQLNLKDL